MYREILNKDQQELLPLVAQFGREFYLVGGTAVALQIGHRRSIDFDLFKNTLLRPAKVVSKISAKGYPFEITRRVEDQLNVNVKNVKFTFFQYPFKIACPLSFGGIRMPDLLTLASMKAYALGRRSKWKDYIDLYFIIKYHKSIKNIIETADNIYGELFSEKLFRAQLSYFDDIDMSEPIDFLVPEISAEKVKNYLINVSTDIL